MNVTKKHIAIVTIVGFLFWMTMEHLGVYAKIEKML
jgi:hypothetical protein